MWRCDSKQYDFAISPNSKTKGVSLACDCLAKSPQINYNWQLRCRNLTFRQMYIEREISILTAWLKPAEAYCTIGLVAPLCCDPLIRFKWKI